MFQISSKDYLTRYEFARLIAKTFKKDENLIQRTTLPFPDDSNNSKVGNKTQTDQYFFRMDTFNVQDFLGTAMPTVEESLQLTFKRLSVQTLA